jgi:hypothetical protein
MGSAGSLKLEFGLGIETGKNLTWIEVINSIETAL